MWISRGCVQDNLPLPQVTKMLLNQTRDHITVRERQHNLVTVFSGLPLRCHKPNQSSQRDHRVHVDCDRSHSPRFHHEKIGTQAPIPKDPRRSVLLSSCTGFSLHGTTYSNLRSNEPFTLNAQLSGIRFTKNKRCCLRRGKEEHGIVSNPTQKSLVHINATRM